MEALDRRLLKIVSKKEVGSFKNIFCEVVKYFPNISQDRILERLESLGYYSDEKGKGIVKKSKQTIILPSKKFVVHNEVVSKESLSMFAIRDRLEEVPGNYRDKEKKQWYKKKRGIGNSQVQVKHKNVMCSWEEDFQQICAKYNYSAEFNPAIVALARQIEKKEIVTSQEKALRKDCRNDLIVTIDGEDAKDLDDAISFSLNEKERVLTVHIADVSHYVHEGDLLDCEAAQRGNSVYLSDKVIPMLPEELSNGICSLNSNQDRLALSIRVYMALDSCDILRYEIFQSIIQVKYCLTYSEVSNLLGEGEVNSKVEDDARFVELKQDIELCSMLKNMSVVMRELYQKRVTNGSIDFDFEEIEVSGGSIVPLKVKKKIRLSSHRIIEEFMLLANKLIADCLIQQSSLGIYRVHKPPKKSDIAKLNRLVRSFGYEEVFVRENEGIHPKVFQKLLMAASGRKEAKMIHLLVLRSMTQSSYDVRSGIHFALSFPYYTHFTSPIRRYADLLAHRLIKATLGLDAKIKIVNKNKKRLKELAEHVSEMERKAMDAERELLRKRMVAFMSTKIGECFDAFISGIVEYGIFVELKKYGVEGLVRVHDLPGYWRFDAKNVALYLKSNTKTQFRVGNGVEVTLVRSDLENGWLDFIINNIEGRGK